MNIWDYFKCFPMFESYFGDKNAYLSENEIRMFQNLDQRESEQIFYFTEILKNFSILSFQGISKELLEITIEILYKVVIFPFNFNYFDYSSDPKSTEISIVIFPEQTLSLLTDFELYGLLHQLYLGCK